LLPGLLPLPPSPLLRMLLLPLAAECLPLPRVAAAVSASWYLAADAACLRVVDVVL
jgi:hypothetical protein